MCGIVGILGRQPAAVLLLDALKRLEYRGYDSAGIATLVNGGIERRRAEGKLVNLERALEQEPLPGVVGIGHTRWATHGAPTRDNAHPHQAGGVAVVHNGIIENFQVLRDELIARGHRFETETDTEVIPQLVSHYLDQGIGPAAAAAAALKRLDGAFALAILFAGHDDLLIGARRGSPLAVGYGDGEMYLGSDALALAPLTNRIQYLEEGDWAVLNPARCCRLRRRGPTGGARDQADRVVRRADRQGQLPPLHAQGDPRAAGRDRRHAADLREPGRPSRHPARAAGRLRHPAEAGHGGVRHRVLRLHGRQVLVRAAGRPAGRPGYRLRVPLPRHAARARQARRCSCRSRARPRTRSPPCATSSGSG